MWGFVQDFGTFDAVAIDVCNEGFDHFTQWVLAIPEFVRETVIEEVRFAGIFRLSIEKIQFSFCIDMGASACLPLLG